MNRAARRQRLLASQKSEDQKAKQTRVATNAKRSATEFFVISCLNMLFGVFGVGVAPFVAHWVVALVDGDPSPRFQQDLYLLALVLWGGTFYEMRCNDGNLRLVFLRYYSQTMHWVCPILAAAMAVAYAFLVAKPNSPPAVSLANPFLLGVLLGITVLGYLIFKIPILWAAAEDAAAKE